MTVTAVEIAINEGADAIHEIKLPGQSASAKSTVVIETEVKLAPGLNTIPVTCELSPVAGLDAFVSVSCVGIEGYGYGFKVVS